MFKGLAQLVHRPPLMRYNPRVRHSVFFRSRPNGDNTDYFSLSKFCSCQSQTYVKPMIHVPCNSNTANTKSVPKPVPQNLKRNRKTDQVAETSTRQTSNTGNRERKEPSQITTETSTFLSLSLSSQQQVDDEIETIISNAIINFLFETSFYLT